MQFNINRDLLLKSLNFVQGVVEKKNTLPILSNVLLEASGKELIITATDLDMIFVHRIQSVEIENREILDKKVKELEEQYEGKEIPRPEFWGGYLIDLNYWEFWQGRKNRTHDRFSYSKVDKGWKIKRLSP